MLNRTTTVAPLLFATMLVVAPAAIAETPFDGDFWTTWADGKAELSTYELVYPRYREPRRATAVAIFVTEGFSISRRVKVDDQTGDSDVVPVMKLNLVVDFPTGIYDYNMMTSTFVTTASKPNLDAGSVLKVSFSSQEWCGHVYQQLLPDEDGVRLQQHSYFDGEADRAETLSSPKDAVLEDALFHWARGFAAPFVDRGDEVSVQLLTASDTVRLAHQKATWRGAKLRRHRDAETIEVTAGAFEVERREADVPGHRSWTFWVEVTAPHRIVAWSTSDGQRGELVESKRLRYWQMNGVDDEGTVRELGLTPRPRRGM